MSTTALQDLITHLDRRRIDYTLDGNSLSVGGSLYLRGTGITSLPEGLSVGGSLDLRGTGITSLPEGLSVGGYLYLRGTGITSLPEGLSVGGSLDLEGTGITSLPEGLSVGGSLYLRGTGITSLPEGLSVGGSLYLRGTGITSLPEGLSVGGSLDLEGTGITSLPEGLSISGIDFDPTKQLIDCSSFQDGCGRHQRRLLCVHVQGDFHIQAGCFFGPFSTFCERVEAEYSGDAARAYIAKAQACVDDLARKLGKDSA